MIRKALYTFDDDSKTGLDKVPLLAPILCNDYGGYAKMFAMTSKSTVGSGTTISTFLDTDDWIPLAPDSLPIGTVLDYAGTTIPDGYLQCNGGAISRTTYADLFAAIGTLWDTTGGAAAPAGTLFRIPPSVLGGVGVFTRASATVTTGTYQSAQNLTHTHTGPSHNHTGPSHTHTGPSHLHSVDAHVHSLAHNHGSATTGSDAHNHTASGATTTRSVNRYISGASTVSVALRGTVTTSSDTHSHSFNMPNFTGNTGGASASSTGNAGTGATGPSGTAVTGDAGTGATGGNGGADLRPGTITMTKIIKY